MIVSDFERTQALYRCFRQKFSSFVVYLAYECKDIDCAGFYYADDYNLVIRAPTAEKLMEKSKQVFKEFENGWTEGDFRGLKVELRNIYIVKSKVPDKYLKMSKIAIFWVLVLNSHSYNNMTFNPP